MKKANLLFRMSLKNNSLLFTMKRTITNKIKIICRVRPFHNHEFPDDSVEVDNKSITVQDQRNFGNLMSFRFASCYSMETTQSEIFEQDVQPLIERVFEGYDATIFVYGVTGSGKTYTMEGAQHQPGIIPRVATYLFETKEASKISNIQITMSYMEIFKETVYDLLVPRDKMQRGGLDIREGPDREVFVANISEQELETLDDFEQIFNKASRNRSTASTKLNKRSSRSHAILSLNITISTPTNNRMDITQSHTVFGKVNLIDLAGSEDNRKTENKKDRMTESAAINKSLFVLGQVVEALNKGLTRVPFRDSKMTRILQPTLEGNSLGMMIINVAPGRDHLQDTINTLNFASRSKKIKSRSKGIQHSPLLPSIHDGLPFENQQQTPNRLLKRPLEYDSRRHNASLKLPRRDRHALPGYRRPTTVSEVNKSRFTTDYLQSNSSIGSNTGACINIAKNNKNKDDLIIISRKDLEDLLDRRINEVLSKHPLMNSSRSDYSRESGSDSTI
ncbi:P-loop containing nucleoside triphosphate hydrolase protein [Phascolomyces articulosus]|uniref:Kinesin-like protein n=1 Tax=Phascolomyces articulosus TaxID=60185 RepID=A0AAD5PI52_9FUNG|nr:P-loop containing nucleoside triphosphate hydrolase protein [Phascolomyces articulosus]